MQRPRILVLIGGIAVVVALSPALGAVALAAEPTVVIRPGDTLTAISKRHGVPIRRLVDLNRLADPNRIYAGQRLRIGSEGAGRPRPTARAKAPGRTVAVRPGDTLTAISNRYGVPIRRLVEINRLADPNRIYVGQPLRIGSQVTPAARPAATRARVHVVERGSTLWHIARHYGVRVSDIVAANGISNPSRIFAGQRLTIPGGRAPAQAAPASESRTARAMPASMARLVEEREPVRRLIVREADRWGVPRAFALAVAWQESGWQQRVTSHAGAVGVMQLMPATAEWVGQTMLDAPVDMHLTRSNVRAGVRLLKHYLQRYNGNRDLVLAAYYQGQAAVDRHGIYAVSRPYIASVRALERLFGS